MMLSLTRTRRRPRSSRQFAIALLALAGAAAGQTQIWTQSLQAPDDRLGGYAAAFDTARGRLVAFGQDAAQSPTTWEWDGQHWIACRPAHSPPALIGHHLFYDSVRQRTVLILGRQGILNNLDAWLWDGEDWTRGSSQWLPAVGTTPAFDSVRGMGVVCVSFVFSLTFEWDGSTWTVVSPTAPPGQGPLVFDAARQQTVMFATDSSAMTCGTWTWDGSSWTRQQPGTSPPLLVDGIMAFDAARQRVVLCGGWILGASGSPLNRDTWEWDGSDWTCIANASLPVLNPGSVHFDPAIQQLVLMSPSIYGFVRWRWDGTAWQSLPILMPPTSPSAVCTYDAIQHRAVLFGGFAALTPTLTNDTWEWDGANWSQRQPAVSPPVRRGHLLIADPANGQMLLFGGTQNIGAPTSVALGDTWLWDGIIWTQAQPTASPPGRAFAAGSYDSSRLRIVMFGGEATPGVALGDTWEWNGTDWLPMLPAQAPPARAGHAMTFDPLRGRTILFGGSGPGAAGWTELGDTWEWDGSTWSASAAVGPQPRQLCGMTFDSGRRRTLLVGGYAAHPTSWPPQIVFHDAWEWDGQAWTASTLQLPTAASWPMDLYGIGLFEDRFARLVLNTKEHGTWMLKQPQPASNQTLGPGCGSPQTNLLADPAYLGNAGFALTMTGAPPQSPSLLLLGLPSPSMPIGGGCDLYMTSSLATCFALVDQEGVAQWHCPMPSSPRWIGTTLHAQAAAIGSHGLLLSPGRRLRLGD